MSYLAQLQDMRQRPDAIGQAIIGVGQLAGGIQQAQTDAEDRQRKLEDRLREIATGKASALQKVGQAYADNGNMQAAGKLIPDFARSFNQAYGTDLSTAPIVGSPVMKQGMERIPTEQLGPAMPGKLMPKVPVETPAPYQYDTGERTFGPKSEAAIRGGLLLPKVKPETFELSPGQTRYEQIPGKPAKVVASADFRPTKDAATRYDVDPVTGEVKAVVPGTIFGVKPNKADKDTSMKEYNKTYAEWQQRGASYVNDYVSLMARNSQRTRQTPTGVVNLPPTPEQMKAWREEGAKAWRDQVSPPMPPGGVGRSDPFGNPNTPGGGKAAPARRGQANVTPPVKYDDTALLPKWESYAQAALAVAPGVEISSRARSKARNANAKPGGGAPNSWHTHRQAFDVVKYNDAQKTKLRAWARSTGLHMIDEGNHLHFQPAQVSDAGQAPALVAFYEKHGIKPGADNA
jgi:hypothetical protein